MQKTYIVWALIPLISMSTFAEDQCSDILIAAVEQYSDSSYRKLNTHILDAMCSEEMRNEMRNSSGSTGGGFLDIIKFSGGGAHRTESSFVNKRCSKYSKNLSLDEARNLLTLSTSEQAVQAWQACIERDNPTRNPLSCRIKSVNYKDKRIQINIRYLANHGPATDIEYTVDNGEIIGNLKETFKPSSMYKKSFIIHDTSKPVTFEIQGNAQYADPNCSVTVPSQPKLNRPDPLDSDICEFRRREAENNREITYFDYLGLKGLDYVPLHITGDSEYAPRVSCSEYKSWY